MTTSASRPFLTGAWRSSAVALGGLAALIDTARTELCSRGRADNPFQRMRFGQMVIAHETGRLWLLEAVKRVDSATADRGRGLRQPSARTAVEAACPRCPAAHSTTRSLGLSAFMRGSKNRGASPRDLATCLRQPAPDEVLVEGAARPLHPSWI